MGKNRDIVIAGLITLSIVGAMYYFMFRKKIVMSNKKLSLGKGYKNKKDIILSMPDTKMKEYPLLVVFGGMAYATPEWMYSKIPKDVLYNAIVVIADYETSFTDVKKKYEEYFLKNDIRIKDTSLFGFSAGGLQVQKAYSPDFRLVGMIDSSVSNENSLKKYSDNVILSMNIYNWSTTYDNYKTRYANLKDSIVKGGGKVEDTKKPHADFPNYFFETYKKNII